MRIVALLTLLATSAAVACSSSRAATVAVEKPTVAVVKAEMNDLSRTLTLAAEFRPFQEIDVHAKVAGYLKTILVDVGDQVKEGQLLAVLEIPELRDEAQQDEATVHRSAEEINRAQADLERSESAHEVAHLAATRLAGVLKSRPNLVAQQEIDDAAARDRMAEAQVSTSKATLAAAKQQLEVSNAMTSLATIFGLIPMALKLGTGSEAYAPLARAIIGGLTVSVVLTVFIVPAAYLLVYRRRGVHSEPEAA